MYPPVAKLHSFAPVIASSAYAFPSSDPTYTTPLATAGEEETPFPVVKLHTFAPVEASRAYTLPSSDATYSTSLTTAGEDSILSAVGKLQATCSPETLEVFSTFSKGLSPERALS